jgi:hypothetical protein
LKYDCPFIKDVKILNPTNDTYVDARMGLDTGYEGEGLITYEAVRDLLDMTDIISPVDESVCVCLNGEELRADGKIILRWKGESFRKVCEMLPWQIVLGANVIRDHCILKFMGFGGKRPLLCKRSAEERAKDSVRKKEHIEEAAANDARVAAHKKGKRMDTLRTSSQASSGSRSSGSSSESGSTSE